MKGLFINETKEVDMKKILTLTAILLTANFALANEGTPPPPHEGKGPHHRGGHMFKKIDTDGNGVITKAEHDAFSNKKFDEIDANKDGQVTKEEGKAFREQMRKKWGKFKGKHPRDEMHENAPKPE